MLEMTARLRNVEEMLNNTFRPKVLIKKVHKDAIIPKYQTEGSSGLDLHADLRLFKKDDDDKCSFVIEPNSVYCVPTGISIELPAFTEAQIRTRSGLASKHGIVVANSPGTIDRDFRGEIQVIIKNTSNTSFKIDNGMRIAQMVISPVCQAQVAESDELEETQRNEGGLGSTGV